MGQQTSLFQTLAGLYIKPSISTESLAAAKAKKAKKFKAPKPKLYCKVPGSCVADPGRGATTRPPPHGSPTKSVVARHWETEKLLVWLSEIFARTLLHKWCN